VHFTDTEKKIFSIRLHKTASFHGTNSHSTAWMKNSGVHANT
jgi:hypothetical protein